MINKRKYITRCLSGILITTILLCGCGKTEEIPTLIEPVSNNQAFRPVERRTLGNPKILVGQIVPQEYCHFFKKSTIIKEFTCDIGQYVNEGDILAYADVEQLQDDLEEKKAALALCIAIHELSKPIPKYTLNSLMSQRSACEYQEDTDGASKITTQIKVETENQKYDEELFNFMVQSYNEEIADLEELITDGTLKAKKSGYVTYIKNTATGNRANVNENVVIVSDYTDTHIEVPNITLKNYTYKDYEVKYTKIDGKEIEIDEYDYSSEEQNYSKAQDCYPNVRFKTAEEINGKPGDTVILYFLHSDKKQVLAIGLDSSNSDDNGNYVYVKGEEGNLEKRYFEPGSSDDNYIEVKSGLKEGELVLYVQDAATPPDYEPYTVKLTDYKQSLDAKRYKAADTINTAYFTPCDGTVESVLVSVDDVVKKGDPLLIIDSGGGKSALASAETDIKHLEQDYTKQCKELDKQIGLMSEQMGKHYTTIDMYESSLSEHEIDAINCQIASLINETKILNIQKELAKLEYYNSLQQLTKAYEKVQKNNDGSGKITIVASADGIVGKTYVKKGTQVKLNGENSLLLSCSKQSDTMLTISMSQDENIALNAGLIGLGCKLTLTGKDKNYEAVCVGSTHNRGKCYAFTEGNKVYVTKCPSDNQATNTFIANVTDSSFFEGNSLPESSATVDVLNLPQMIVLPGYMVYSEELVLVEKTRYFVWKINNNELVKQYVTIGTDYGVGNNTEVVVLLGLSEGDVLARDKNAAVSEEN